jgi:hypothetical protein
MRRSILAILLLFIALLPASAKAEKPALMWIDGEANLARFSSTDSIDFYLAKIRSAGFTHIVVDIRPITGEVIYDSRYLPRYGRPTAFDYLGYWLSQGHKLGLKVFASMNVFCAGHNYFDKGLVYSGHSEWASQVFDAARGVIPITEQKHKYGAMVNPLCKDYQQLMLKVMEEIVTKYPALDGLMLDRVRYDGIEADFSPLSRSEFEKFIGAKVSDFPSDILSWHKRAVGKGYDVVEGRWFRQWLSFRAKSIHDFMVKAREAVKKANSNVQFADYTGAWYPSYYECGVNFASRNYDPSHQFKWALPDYYKYGYAELLDLFTVGNYYTDVSIDDYNAHHTAVRNETDNSSSESDWYSVQGSCRKLRTILDGHKFLGGVLVSQFRHHPENLSASIAMNIQESDGLMVFDISHVIHRNLWSAVTDGIKLGGK